MSVLTRDAILNIHKEVHLVLSTNGVSFEEVCAGTCVSYDDKGLIVVLEGEQLRYLWRGLSGIATCPGKDKHPTGVREGQIPE